MTDREPPADTAPPGLTHVRDDGTAHMVDVTGKSETTRVATAQARLTTRGDVVARLVEGTLPKGEALGTARIAGIMAAKRTSSLIPLCHPLPLTSVAIDLELDDTGISVIVTAATDAKTGVEMEALTAASIAALTLYDMIKAVDPLAEIHDVKVLAKQGGKSGDWAR